MPPVFSHGQRQKKQETRGLFPKALQNPVPQVSLFDRSASSRGRFEWCTTRGVRGVQALCKLARCGKPSSKFNSTSTDTHVGIFVQYPNTISPNTISKYNIKAPYIGRRKRHGDLLCNFCATSSVDIAKLKVKRAHDRP